MSKEWPKVPLGEVLTKAEDRHALRPDAKYPNFGICSFGRGLFEKQPIDGATSSAAGLYRASARQFVYSRLFAFEGAYGLVPEQYDGWFVSNEFPLFDCDQTRLLPDFLGWCFRSKRVWQEVAQSTTGMGDRRRRVQPDAFLTYRIALPPLSEQRRIVAKIEQLASKIEEARSLRGNSQAEAVVLMKPARRTVIGEHVSDSWVPLRDLVADIDNGWSPACLKQPASAQEWGVIKLGAVSFGRFDPTENKQLPPTVPPIHEYEIRPGDFLMSRANTTELVGACTIVRQTRPRLLLCDKVFRFSFKGQSPIEPTYLDHALKSPALRQQIEAAATGTSPSMKNISKPKILSLRVPVPPLPEQRRIVAYLDDLQTNVDQLKTVQAQTAAELDALLPSILDKAFRGEL